MLHPKWDYPQRYTITYFYLFLGTRITQSQSRQASTDLLAGRPKGIKAK